MAGVVDRLSAGWCGRPCRRHRMGRRGAGVVCTGPGKHVAATVDDWLTHGANFGAGQGACENLGADTIDVAHGQGETWFFPLAHGKVRSLGYPARGPQYFVAAL